ncbi:uncharacterized protein K02A2.6-like [Uranotaenia lowii]|uniref:uncharacterized protein K02A2.6-like n=1 Tax=Uranotaenia lowii TaxID=190385 RepID=UPI0024783911|nr:uncharacterized protein K02A2.6-like [Uranotaenia lowii]
MCVDLKLSALTEEQFKCLIFVAGLKSPKDADIRMRLITQLNESSDITLAKIIEDCRNLSNLKNDNVMVEKQSPVSVHAVKEKTYKNNKPKRKQMGEKPVTDHLRSPCWSCGGMHYSKDCQFRDHLCRECGNPKRPVAFSVKGSVEQEINRLHNLGVLQPVDFSDWAVPIVAVRKPNDSVRICADFSTGLNSVLEANQYPLPLPDDIFARMSGCRVFRHIDLSDAYLQVVVDENSQPLLIINTHLGLYRFTRLSPGIKSAPGASQPITDAMTSGLQFTSGYIDDAIVAGRSEEEHNRNLHLFLGRLQEYGFTVRIVKCRFFMSQIKHLGHILDGDGIRPDPEKASAIATMPPPHDISTLRSYLGAVNYYGKYIPEMRKLRFPMDTLLKTGVKWEWSDACQKSFDRFNQLLQSTLALTHYNPALEIVVSADASSIGIGARIAHRFPDGTI